MTHFTFARLSLVVMAFVAAFFAWLYITSVGPYWKLTPDSTTYVLAAESIAAGEGYREAGSPVVLFAPGTSGMMAPAWIAGKKSYRALNAEVVLFAFASLAVCFLLFRDSLGTVGSGAVVLLCLGSAEFFERSTFLLSEVFYVFFSLLAFWCYRRGRITGTALSSLAALMVRSVGVCLPVAFVLDTLFLDALGKRPKRWAHLAAYGMPLLFSVAWELRNRRLGWSYSELMSENDPWNRSGGHITAAGLLSRLWDNLAYGRALEDLLTNNLTRDLKHANWAIWPGLLLGALIAGGGWRLTLDRESTQATPVNGQTALAIYCSLFSITVALYWPSVVIRLFVPLLPFLAAYLVAGIQAAADRPFGKWVYAAAGCFFGIYLTTGFRADQALIAEDRTPPPPGQLVKYPGREDMLWLAAWGKEHAANNDVYACQFPNIISVVTGRPGIHYENNGQPESLKNAMRLRHARFLLLDTNSGSDRAVAGLAAQDRQFRLLKQQGRAELYELAQQ